MSGRALLTAVGALVSVGCRPRPCAIEHEETYPVANLMHLQSAQHCPPWLSLIPMPCSRFDWPRLARFAFFAGTFGGPVGHYWYKLLDAVGGLCL